MKDYLSEWSKKHPDYRKEWFRKHPDYMKDYLKEWRHNMNGIDVGFRLKVEDMSLAGVSRLDESFRREVDDVLRKDFGSKQDEL